MPEAPKRPDAQAARKADQTSADADHASTGADLLATGRDDAAADREVVSDARDRAAAARDRAAEELEFAQGPGGPEYELAIAQAGEVRAQAAADRELAAADRTRATLDRRDAERDRARAARDREHAAKDRAHAAMDRRAARDELDRAHTDDLTGAYRRGAGEIALEHEMARARRSGEGLVMAYVDLDGLKATNDRYGHAAGDVRLRDMVVAMRSTLRSYEPVVRYGGDEFVCSITGATLEAVRDRFTEIGAAVQGDRDHPGGMSVGFAEMRADDTLKTLIDRADSALIAVRRAARAGS